MAELKILASFFSAAPFCCITNCYNGYTGKFFCELYYTTIFSCDRVFEAAKMHKELIRGWKCEDGLLGDRNCVGKGCEECWNKRRGEWMLCSLADVAGNVVCRDGSRRQ